ncbi:hypothetical protein [Streptomyces sp. HPF1205]|uniref:hypothetical protein n=1 Tax=Streptomyces sp. HPF1205 TaxID=2873262 RepID=UPI001CED80AA|nr:hypothetical protein [Streptomyces sp. HPF1205]
MALYIMSSGRIHIALRAPEGDQRDNPFAPPPEGAPDRPWQPRLPQGQDGGSRGEGGSRDGARGSGEHGQGDQGDQSGPAGQGPGRQGGAGGRGGAGGGSGPDGQGAPPPPVWGSQWSSRQPQSGRPEPFARRPDAPPTGPQGQGPRFDPTDPAQRRSRYALVCGGWGLIFVLFGWIAVGFLLGALALYWGVSALRMSPEDRARARASAASALADATQTPRPAPPAPGPDAQRSFLTAAWTGIIASAITLALVATAYAFQLAYRDYYTCKSDALTTPASQSCEKLLPAPFRHLSAFHD